MHHNQECRTRGNPRVAWFSPVCSDTLSRAVESTRALVPSLSKNWDITLFVGDNDWRHLPQISSQPDKHAATESEVQHDIAVGPPTILPSDIPTIYGCGVYHHLSAFLLDSDSPYDFAVYQLENSEGSGFVQQVSRFFPGFSIFHDFHFDKIPLGTLAQMAHIAVAFDDRGVGCLEDLQIRAPIVQMGYPLCDIHIRPNGIPSNQTASSSLSIAFAGQNLAEDRIVPFLSAVHRLAQEHSVEVHWLLDSKEKVNHFSSRLAAFEDTWPDIGKILTLHSYVDTTDVASKLDSIDVYVGVKFDLLRATPVPLLVAIKMGIPCLVSDFGVGAEFHNDTVIKLPLGAHEDLGIAQALQSLIDRPHVASFIGASGRDYAHSCLSIESAVSDLLCAYDMHADYLRREVAVYRDTIQHSQVDLLRRARRSNVMQQQLGQRIEGIDCHAT